MCFYLPPACCSEVAGPWQPYLPQAWSLREENLVLEPAQPWVRWCRGEPRASSMAGALCFADPARQ